MIVAILISLGTLSVFLGLVFLYGNDYRAACAFLAFDCFLTNLAIIRMLLSEADSP